MISNDRQCCGRSPWSDLPEDSSPRRIQVKDKTFAVSIPEKDILSQVARVAASINEDYRDKSPVFLAVLNGSFIFAADLLREVTVP